MRHARARWEMGGKTSGETAAGPNDALVTIGEADFLAALATEAVDANARMAKVDAEAMVIVRLEVDL